MLPKMFDSLSLPHSQQKLHLWDFFSECENIFKWMNKIWHTSNISLFPLPWKIVSLYQPISEEREKGKKYSLWCLLNSKTNVFFWISKNYEMIDPLMLFNGINTSRRTSNVLDPITWVSWNYGRGGKTLDVRGCNKYFWRAL